jgi:tyrosine-protein phosphatase YwqE
MWLISNKTFVRDSGLLENFHDCHCHLLPNVDDGVKETDETLQILEEWEDLGVKEVWLTPHVMEDVPNTPKDLKQAFEKLNTKYRGKIELHLAAENMMDGLFTNRLQENDLLPIGIEGKHLLIETSYYIPPINMEEIIEKIKSKKYIPILAHPERYQYMDATAYRKWKQRGVLLQLNLPSLVGAYGPEALHKAEWLLNQGLYDFCGSDTHSINHTRYFLNSMIKKKTVKKVRKLIANTFIIE